MFLLFQYRFRYKKNVHIKFNNFQRKKLYVITYIYGRNILFLRSSDWLETVLQIAETQRFTVNLNRIRPDNAPETQTRKRARRGNQNATSKKPRVTRPKKK